MEKVARRDIGRYYQLLEDELREVDLSEHEAALVYEALSAQGDMLARMGGHYLWAAIPEVLGQHPASRFPDVDVPALIAKLRGLSLAANLAIVDAVERARLMPEVSKDQALRAVGLLRDRP